MIQWSNSYAMSLGLVGGSGIGNFANGEGAQMRIGTLCLAGITCAGLAGCANMLITSTYTSPSLRHFTTLIACSSNCSIGVQIVEYPDRTCKPVSIDPIDLSGDNGVRGVTFRLGNGYKFVNDAYSLAFFMKDNPQGKFRGSVVPADGKSVIVKFAVENGVGNRNYAYGLNVQRDDGTFCASLDPWMIS